MLASMKTTNHMWLLSTLNIANGRKHSIFHCIVLLDVNLCSHFSSKLNIQVLEPYFPSLANHQTQLLKALVKDTPLFCRLSCSGSAVKSKNLFLIWFIFVCSCTCKWKPEVDIGCFPLSLYLIFWDEVSHWNWSWPTKSTCLCLTSTGITDMPHCTHLKFRVSCLNSKHSTVFQPRLFCCCCSF